MRDARYTTLVLLLAGIAALHAAEAQPPSLQAAAGEPLYTQTGTDPSFAAVLESGNNMLGKSLSIKVRANGTDYEVYQKAPLDGGPWKLLTRGSYTKAKDNQITFRWGMYCGSKKGQSVPNDALIFVTGATIR